MRVKLRRCQSKRHNNGRLAARTVALQPQWQLDSEPKNNREGRKNGLQKQNDSSRKNERTNMRASKQHNFSEISKTGAGGEIKKKT